jgi:hypothetical protein
MKRAQIASNANDGASLPLRMFVGRLYSSSLELAIGIHHLQYSFLLEILVDCCSDLGCMRRDRHLIKSIENIQ